MANDMNCELEPFGRISRFNEGNRNARLSIFKGGKNHLKVLWFADGPQWMWAGEAGEGEGELGEEGRPCPYSKVTFR